MPQLSWTGVMPAITTPLTEDLAVDSAFLSRHTAWLIEHGASAIIALGSLGEGATLRFDEKLDVLDACLQGAKATDTPVVAAISSLSTTEAVELAQRAADLGCAGLMVLPPYVHKGEWAEIKGHFAAILQATPLPAMIYNNPIAYGTDLSAENIAELAADHANVQAVKESSGDSRRVTAIRALLGDRVAISVGLDDMVVEGVAAGAVGWVAGLVNALPEESVRLFELARDGRMDEAFALYRWFLPLLRLDTVPEFVQWIKLVQQEVGMGDERVRPPRLEMAGEERERVLELVRTSLGERLAA